MKVVHTKLWSLTVAGALASAAVIAAPRLPVPAAPTTLRAMYGLHAPERLSRARTALLLVDFQEEFLHGRLVLPDGPSAVAHAAKLLAWARRSAIPVIHVRNEVSKPGSLLFAVGSPTTRFVPELQPLPGELVVTKSMMGAFSRTNLHQELQARRIDTLLIAGLMTHLAVQTTAADATVLGYRAVVVADAAATRALPGAGGLGGVDAATLQRASLAILADRVADVVPTRAVVEVPIDE